MLYNNWSSHLHPLFLSDIAGSSYKPDNLNLATDLLNELGQEAIVTRQYLALVPFEKADYKPHPKSETLGRLAIHVAEIMAWYKSVLTQKELDFIAFEPEDIRSTGELLAYFDKLTFEAKDALANCRPEVFEDFWSMRNGETIYFTLPKKQVIRTFVGNHLVHHRAQLGTYLRLLDIAVPATYGPSADHENVTLINSY